METTPGLVRTNPGLVETTPGLVETTPGLVGTNPGLVGTTPGNRTPAFSDGQGEAKPGHYLPDNRRHASTMRFRESRTVTA